MKKYDTPKMKMIRSDRSDILTLSAISAGKGDSWDVGASLARSSDRQ